MDLFRQAIIGRSVKSIAVLQQESRTEKHKTLSLWHHAEKRRLIYIIKMYLLCTLW